ncbi:T9SS type A sorting domain-containing protein [Flavobacterium sedimenticola]|uniref:T9SS type A sorting domain-containing protein n=1 Tax=Flavobacterium sedimenticola TaxID=3043286 RepID=A0ABT6XS20_9FLAO|nr:T9SS type A sorting domain-containing protein [Flavobacterium sedimenticola]MDI9257892.1 T9SS type A sorting domain-containing protein [Flavobacterium sedimenticola]
MKNLKLLAILLLACWHGYSQKIIQAEFFWNTDPGEGQGIALVAADGNFNSALETVINSNAALPPTGSNVLGVRIKGENGNWSPVFRKVIRVVNGISSNNLVKITQAEYFWDNDPGEGQGISLLAFDGNFNQAIETVFNSTANLPAVGNHVLGLRVKANDGNWGPVYRKFFRLSQNNNTNLSLKITQAEYFWDNDPGVGQGTALLAFDGNFNQAMETVFTNNANLPSVGNHVLGLRVKANDGNWSPVYRKVFRLSQNNNTNLSLKITQAEYFWDNDPGIGQGTALLAFDGNFNQAIETIFTSSASLPAIGNHVLGLRVKADDGNWGTVFRKVFRLSENNNTNNLVKLTQAEYFWNTDPGQGNGLAMVAFDGNFSDAMETILSTNASLPSSGVNLLNVRAKASDGNWGPVYSKVVGVNITYDTSVILISPANGTINQPTTGNFVWNGITGVANYEYQCATDSNFNNIVLSGIVNNTTVPFSGLSVNTTYYWRVRVNMSGNVSLWSAVWNFTTDSNLTNNEVALNSTFLYPVPTKEFLILKSSFDTAFHYEILAIDGKSIQTGTIFSDDQINVSRLPSGAYLMKLDNNSTVTTLRFIKE